MVSQRGEIVARDNTGVTSGLAAALLPELIARQAAATPHATAVVDGSRRLSYVELQARADQLAGFLLHLGAGPGTVVAICLRRSVDLVVALLGVWRAGLAYVPLDPERPRDRLAWQLADTGTRLVLTEQALAGVLPDGAATVVRLDTDHARIAAEAGAVPAPATVDPDGAAYTIYTSGSTGRPKGVVITHAGIANRVRWTVRQHRLSTSDRVLQKTALIFDAAGWEIFAPLVSGGTVVMAPVGVERDPAALVRALAEYRITVLQVVPSVLRLLVDEPDWSGCASLRLVFSAGEPLHAELCQRLLAHVRVEVWNTYGPTECSIDVAAERFDPAQGAGQVAIGRPIDNTRLLVLDRVGMPVPVGVPGELHVGGAGLARGYLGRPDLTAERFVPDRFGKPGARLYRTGDLVRWHSDGTLAYLGRLDNQVKVNGIRVEPGEVEAALLRHPDINSAVVKGYTDAAGNSRLAAYLLRRDIAQPQTLRAFLADHLPAPLIPTDFITVDGYPLTSSGKVDRAALPDPDLGESSGRPSFTAAGSDAERVVARVWSELLGVTDVGADDNFFQLGGSSLLMTRLASRLTAAVGRDVTVPDLYYAVTVAAQARLITVDQPDPPPTRRATLGEELPLSFGQQRQWFLDRMRPGSAQWVAPMVVSLSADLPVAVVRRAVNAVQARHEALRTRYVITSAGDPAQVIDEPGAVPLRVAHLTDGSLVDQALTDLFAEEFAYGFDLEHGPLIRALLVRHTATEQILLLTMHHIACDGWSTVVLENDIREYCAAFDGNREPVPAAPGMRYADFAVWQRHWLSGERMNRDLAYWRTALAAATPLHLPIDRPRPREFDPRGALTPFHVPGDVAGQLVALGRQHGATPFMTFLTAYGLLLSRYSGQSDIPVGVPVSGRIHPQVAGTVGFFLNSLVLRCDFSDAPTFVEALGRIRDMSLASFTHQSLPFERLVDELVAERDLSRTPLYQAEFDLHEEGLTGTSLDGAGMAAFQRAWAVARTDICLYLQRRDDGSMSGTIEYATALFDAATIDRFARHFTRLLVAIAADPLAPALELDYLDPVERDALLADRRDDAATAALYRDDARFTGLAAADAHPPTGLRVCLLDQDGALVPTGVAGEVHLGGPRVTLGSVSKVRLPAERFVPDPFGADGSWLYRTRELARRHTDGSVESLGPITDPVRVFGYWLDIRIVNAALTGCDGVREAVVVADGDDLRAYWVGDIDVDIAGHCRAWLSGHQMPGTFVRLERMPRRADGEVDHVALRMTSAPATEHGMPRTVAEQRIAELWADLLGVAEADLDIHASFFGLGGNSILAIRSISALREEFGVDVPVRTFFEEATVAGLAQLVEAKIRAELAALPDDAVLDELLNP